MASSGAPAPVLTVSLVYSAFLFSLGSSPCLHLLFVDMLAVVGSSLASLPGVVSTGAMARRV
ncbi:hypothetical protein Bca52824_046130 [Brassica carinata]|uniref:Uncharacterized protein n=1 Tax=Brassica carinata TaxID=52824 RepID=A0A8X7RDS1_BRACI|nr:hypothetical protein Bca52824_046130 [Brassica carinata]